MSRKGTGDFVKRHQAPLLDECDRLHARIAELEAQAKEDEAALGRMLCLASGTSAEDEAPYIEAAALLAARKRDGGENG